jgi:hypothetical protein
MPDKNSRKTTLTSGNANNVYEKRFKEVYDLTGRRTRISANASFINNVSAGNSRLISKGIYLEPNRRNHTMKKLIY